MRTTLAIDDEILDAAKFRARSQGSTLGSVVEDALRRYLLQAQPTADRPTIPVYRNGRGLRPGVDLSSNRAIHELLDGGADLNSLR
jgi:hypothetical protein